MKVFICQSCGHLQFNETPENCPVCGAPKNKFKQNDNIFEESRQQSPEAEVKHVPSVKVDKECGLIPEDSCTDVHVRIGETLHPMQDKHYIQFIDGYQDEEFIGRMELTPNLQPAAAFHLKKDSGKLILVENCNIHGYWMKEVNI